MQKIFLIALLLVSATALAQQDALFNQYMFNKLVINPAYAGSRKVMTFDLVDRYQWAGIAGAPRTITISGHTPLRNPHVGLGFYVYSDVVGPTTSQGFMGTYAYRIRLEKGILSFGLQLGLNHTDINWDKIFVEVPDIRLQGQGKTKFIPDASFGLYYLTSRFYGGLSSTQLLQNEYGTIIKDGVSTYSKLARHFYAMTGFALPVSDQVVFRPSALLKYVMGAPAQIDLNASFLFNDVFWIGAGYRSKETVIFLTEFNIGQNMRIGYSYDIGLNNLTRNNMGSHEIHIGYDINLLKGRMFVPRYF